MKSSKFVALSFLSALLVSGVSFVNTASAASATDVNTNHSANALNPATKQLRAILENVTKFQAKFKQEVSDKDNKVLSTSSGTLSLERPGKFVMLTTEPDEIALFTKDDGIYYYDASINQLSIFALDNMDATPFMLLAHNADDVVWNEYSITQDGSRFTLVPHKSNDVVSLTLNFIKSKGSKSYDLIDSLTIRMDDGNTNFYRFIDGSHDVDEKELNYSVPKNAEIDDQR